MRQEMILFCFMMLGVYIFGFLTALSYTAGNMIGVVVPFITAAVMGVNAWHNARRY